MLEAAAGGAVSAAACSLDAALREGGALPGPGLRSAPGSRPATPPGAPPHEASLEKLRDLGRDAAPAGPGGARRPSLPAACPAAQRPGPADVQVHVRGVGSNTVHSSSAGPPAGLQCCRMRTGGRARTRVPRVASSLDLDSYRRLGGSTPLSCNAGAYGSPAERLPSRAALAKQARVHPQAGELSASHACWPRSSSPPLYDSSSCTLPRSGVPRVCDCRVVVCHRSRPLARLPHAQRHSRDPCSAPSTVRTRSGEQQHRW